VSEIYGAAWEDRDVPYLASVYDGPGTLDGYPMGLTTEANAERWITSSPPAYCNTDSREMLERILPGFDQETRDFYRWRVENSNEELSDIIHSRTGVDVGRLIALEPVARGESGRIVRLRIVGEKRSIVIGKELEIRRSLSRSHLYSSAFVVRPGFGVGSEGDAASKFPFPRHVPSCGTSSFVQPHYARIFGEGQAWFLRSAQRAQKGPRYGREENGLPRLP